MKRVSNVLKVVGILALIGAFISKKYDITRLVLILCSVVLFTLSYAYKDKREKLNIVICFLLCLFVTYIIDFSFVCFLKYKPIYANKVVSSEKFVTYNSLLYRQFECDKSYFDFLYEKADFCSYGELEEKDINTISSDIINNFSKYKNKFYLIRAKISYKEGNDLIELKSYTEDLESINGNVTFNENIVYKCKIENTKDIEELKLYDNIYIVGRIASMKKNNDIYEVKIKDAYIPKFKETQTYKEYKINAVENKNCKADKQNYVEVNEYKYYTSCLDNVYVVYDENDVYELSYVLKDEKLTYADLIKNYDEKSEEEKDDKKITLYKFENYNMIDCGNKNIIIGDSKLSLKNNYCNAKVADKNEL